MQTQLGEHRTMFHAGDFHQFSDVRFCVFAANIATQCAALLVRRERHLLMQRRTLVHRREEWNGSAGHFGSSALIHKRSDAIARLIADAEEFVFHFIRQAVRHRVVVIHNIPYFFSAHIAVTCIQRFRSFVTGSVDVFFFFAVRQRINKADFCVRAGEGIPGRCTGFLPNHAPQHLQVQEFQYKTRSAGVGSCG